jgi:hypothetical protein
LIAAELITNELAKDCFGNTGSSPTDGYFGAGTGESCSKKTVLGLSKRKVSSIIGYCRVICK